MSKMEEDEIRNRARALSDKEREIFLSETPFTVLWLHMSNRVFSMEEKLNLIKNFMNSIDEGGDKE